MVAEPAKFYTPEEYLELERPAEWKSEYFAGCIMEMPHPNLTHIRLVGEVMCILHAQLRNHPCQVYASQVRVHVEAIDFFAYPDLLIACPPWQFSKYDEDTLTNPVSIIEVLLPASETYDRGAKWSHYQRIPSLRDYVLVAQDKMHIEHYARQDDGSWNYRKVENEDGSVALNSIDCRLTVAEIFECVEFSEAPLTSP